MSVKLSDEFETILKKSGLSTKKIAKLSGLSVSTINKAIKTLSVSSVTAEKLANLLGADIYAVDLKDPSGLIRNLRQAEKAGGKYYTKDTLYVIQVVIDHPTNGVLVRGTFSDRSEADAKVKYFNKTRL